MIDKSEIPTGKSKADIEERRKIIVSALQEYRNKNIYCPCLGADVYVSRDGISETAHHAAKRIESTKAALDLKNAIMGASFVGFDVPKENKQKNRFHFECVFHLKYKNYKLIVGVQKKGKVLHYCITAIV